MLLEPAEGASFERIAFTESCERLKGGFSQFVLELFLPLIVAISFVEAEWSLFLLCHSHALFFVSASSLHDIRLQFGVARIHRTLG